MSTEGTALDGMEQEDRNKDVTEGVLLEERPARLLVRGTPRDSTFSSRLSTVIRRSLRLGPKRSTTATDLGSLAGVGKSLSDQETDVHGRGAKYFTEYAEVKIEHYPKPYGTLPELKRLLQLARRSSVRLMDYFRKHFYIPSYFLMNFATRSYLRFLFSHMISNAVWFICGCVM
uniref:Ion_trans_N domain-containing protein n=1 Tax=Ascaris lumbricoides TaxID=6252 RepID=A0A0M3HQC9_ASCLU